MTQPALPTARRSALGAGLAIAVVTGVLAATPAASAAPVADTGELTICAVGTKGDRSTISLRRKGSVVKSFKLSGCTTRELPVGKYKVTVKAPSGYRVVGVYSDAGVVASEGGVISGASARRINPGKKTVNENAWSADEGKPSVTFTHKRG